MRLITYTDGVEPVKIGILWRDKYVLDLRKALTHYLVSEEYIDYKDAYELSYDFVVSDVVKFIKRWNIIKDITQKVINAYSKSDTNYLIKEGVIKSINEIEFHPVVPNPSKVVGIGLNYEEYRVMLKYPKPEVPLFFFKPVNTLIGHNKHVVIPKGGKWPGTSSKCLFHEFEMAVIIGKKARFIEKNEALKYVFGVTIFSDITAHDIEMIKPGFVLYQQRAKAFDTFSPIGPWIVTMDEILNEGVDIHNLRILRRRNGKVENESNTRNMMYKTWEVLEFLSEVMTLEPGDIVSLGSPPTGPEEGLQPGDIIEAEVEYIGVLRNYVK